MRSMANSPLDGSNIPLGSGDPAPDTSGAARLRWETPQLATHESLTVLTKHFFGPAGVAFALQITCGVSGQKFGC
jgi:hypothetical protein